MLLSRDSEQLKRKLVGDNVPVIITVMHFISIRRRLNSIISENFKAVFLFDV